MSKKLRGTRRKEKNTDLTEYEGDVGEFLTSSTSNFQIKDDFRLTPKHQTFVDLARLDKTKMIFLDGPAGTAKTLLSVSVGLELLKAHHVKKIVYVRSIVESAEKSIGALPGELSEKFAPWTLPMQDKLSELVNVNVAKKLLESGQIQCLPVNFVRGLTFHDSFVIFDEAQNASKSELTTVLTRFGIKSKYMIIGDSMQKDIGNKSGFKPIYDRFNDSECLNAGIHVVEFGENEIVRSPILKLIVKKLS